MATIVDPSGSFGLTAKYKKALEKGKLAEIRLVFSNGEFAAVAVMPSKEGEKEEKILPLAEAMASIASKEVIRPFEDEKSHLVTKYEVRLDEECPEALRNATSKVALDAAVAALQFRKRRALLMSNREFEIAFSRWENGVPVPRPADQADALRMERSTATRGRSSVAPRGRGRGGRGRGSFRAPQGAETGRQGGQNQQPAASAA